MNLAQLRAVFRREIEDAVTPYLVSDAEAAEFATDAEMEAARRALLLIDSTTTAICEIAYTTNPVLSVDTRVIAIRNAIISGQTIPLDLMTMAEMDRDYPGWRSTTAVTPTALIVDWGTAKVRLYPDSTSSGTVLLSVYREPLEALADDADVPEIPARYHRNLVEWMKFRAYSKDDTELEDARKAAKAERAFIAEFGERKSARNEAWSQYGTGRMADCLA